MLVPLLRQICRDSGRRSCPTFTVYVRIDQQMKKMKFKLCYIISRDDETMIQHYQDRNTNPVV